MKRKFFIVGTNCPSTASMFRAFGWEQTKTLAEADLVQFTGGSDVNPALYKEEVHETTQFNANRDNVESAVYHEALNLKKNMAGICRGGQFLNVMNGGKLWQHVHGHTGPHMAWRIDKTGARTEGDRIVVTSTHHQMIRPPSDRPHKIRLIATEGKAKYGINEEEHGGIDVEAVVFEETNCICYQPHPEFCRSDSDCTKFYMSIIEDTFFNKEA